MPLQTLTIYWFRCNDPECTAGSDDLGGDDSVSYETAIEKARAASWLVTRRYAFCPDHKHRYRDDAQRRHKARTAAR